MYIRPAVTDDITALLAVYDAARAFMRKTGNLHQWNNGYPTAAVLFEDIHKKQLYVVIENNRVVASFALIGGADPTYARIEQGAWIDNSPYHTIHRMASDGTCHGIAAFVLNACQARYPHLRVDTHHDNHVMQAVILQNGFIQCGIIYLADGSPRLAYEWVASIKK